MLTILENRRKTSESLEYIHGESETKLNSVFEKIYYMIDYIVFEIILTDYRKINYIKIWLNI